MVYTGPSIQCGLAFNTRKYTRNDFDAEVQQETSNRYTTDVNNELLTRLNITWGIGAGFQYQRYFLRGGYDFGLVNPYKNKQFDGSDRYTRGRFDQWSVKIGMYLWYNE